MPEITSLLLFFVLFLVFLWGQTNDFIGRKLAKRLKTNHTDGAPAENAAVIGEETRTVEVLGRERRKEGEPVDLEVIDDRELYQHLLKVRRMYCVVWCAICKFCVFFFFCIQPCMQH